MTCMMMVDELMLRLSVEQGVFRIPFICEEVL